MQKPARIDFAKLLGFELVTRDISRGVDLQNETVGARLGAKVGIEVTGGIDFQNETFGDKLGAKVGGVEAN
jgi:hypothetical protein